MIRAAQKLHDVKATGWWKESAASWGEYVESELGISPGFASKLDTLYTAWVLNAGLSQDKLAGIDYEKLYLAVPQLENSPAEEVLERARTLTRRELRETRNEEAPHEHEFIEACSICWIKKL